MSKTSNPPNSVWPNGLKVDSEGYAIYYPLGTNKVDISTVEWPVGDKIVTPFVYQNNKLVGFCDTKAMTVSGNTTITMPYEYIDVKFTSIGEGELTVNAPNATYKKFKWNPNFILNFKYKGCKTVDDVKAIEPNYLTVDIVDGVWNERLRDLENGREMFVSNTDILSFNGDLSSLTDGYLMFYGCSNLTTFSSDLSSLADGSYMFQICSNLTNFDSNDLSSLTNGYRMFKECTNLTNFNCNDLGSLTDGEEMFSSCTNLANFNCEDLSSLTNGYQMFRFCDNLTTFASDLSSLDDGEEMFRGCSNLTSFTGDLKSLTDGYYMFYYCTKLTNFNCNDLSSLTDSQDMFRSCKNLTSFALDLKSLTVGRGMFCDCSNFTTFTGDLSSLEDGRYMFGSCSKFTNFNCDDLSSLTNGREMFNKCSNLTSFTLDLSSLTDGYFMFYNCSKLTTFISDLKSLTNGYGMFYNCKLDTDSIVSISETIKQHSNDDKKTIHIGIANSKPNTRESKAFDEIVTKGWTVYVNGSEYIPSMGYSIITLDENGEEISTPVPYYAKPIVSDEEHGDYVDSEGNYYNILGGQFIYGDDLSSYGMFTCEDDAAANMRLTRVVKEEL